MFVKHLRKWFQRTGSPRPRPSGTVLVLEALEDRLVPAVYNVISTADGAGALMQTGANTFNATTLRAAITAANANPGNNTINLIAPGTYLLTQGQLQIFSNPNNVVADETLTINNTSGGTAIVSGGGASRVFDINPTNTALPIDAKTGAHVLVTFNNFTITGGFASDPNGNPDGPNASGGGIRDQNDVDLTLNSVTVTRNVATADGGGISMENTASTPWKLTINNSIISNNRAGDAGGGVETDGSGKVFINGSTITGNTAVNQGAGIWLDGILASNGSVVSTTVINGGTGYTSAPTVTFTGGGGFMLGKAFASVNPATGTVVGVELLDGGAGFTSAPTITLSGGGGTGAVVNANLLVQSANLTVTNSTISNNLSLTPGQFGGGIGNAGNGSVTIVGSSVIDNFAAGFGGGFGDEGNQDTLTILNSTFVGNSAGQNGGAIQEGSFKNITINDSTITHNSAQVLGGGIFGPQKTVFLLDTFILNNTVVAGNFAGPMNFLGGAAPDIFGQVTTANGDFIGIDDSATPGNTFNLFFSNGSTATKLGTPANPLNPLLGPLQNNGGPTLTEAPLPGSPLIGTGVLTAIPTGTTTDQRGLPRSFNNKVDIGAVQTPPTVTPGFLVAEFAGYGVFQFSTATGVWKNLTPANASVLASDAAGDVVADLAGQGVFRFLNATGVWTQLTPVNASLLGMDSAGDVFAEFPGFGLMRFQTATGWQGLTPLNASVLAVDGNGDVAADLAGMGVFLYTAATGTWKNLTPVNANLLAIDNAKDVVAGYNGFGIYRYTVAAGTFTQLTAMNASQLSLDAAGDVFAAIPGAGLFRLLNVPGATFTQLTPANASQLAVDAAGDVFAEFPGFGVQGLFANAIAFRQLTPLDASLLVAS